MVIVSLYFSKCEVVLFKLSMHLMSVCGVAGVFGKSLWFRPYVRSDLSFLCVVMFVSGETTWSKSLLTKFVYLWQ